MPINKKILQLPVVELLMVRQVMKIGGLGVVLQDTAIKKEIHISGMPFSSVVETTLPGVLRPRVTSSGR